MRLHTFLKLFIILFFESITLPSIGQHLSTATTASNISANSTGNISNITWSNTTSAKDADGVFATSLITGSNKTTQSLDFKAWGIQTTNYTLANYIPPYVVINGIEVIIRERKSGAGNIRDNEIILLKNGSSIRLNKAKTNYWTARTSLAKYGSATDLWGIT